MKNFLIALGSSAVAIAFLMSLSYSMDNYGIKENTLSFNVRAQDSGGGGTSGGGGSSGGGSSSGSGGGGTGNNGVVYYIAFIHPFDFCEPTYINGKIITPRFVDFCLKTNQGLPTCPSCWVFEPV